MLCLHSESVAFTVSKSSEGILLSSERYKVEEVISEKVNMPTTRVFHWIVRVIILHLTEISKVQ